jgi:hypothetical protein
MRDDCHSLPFDGGYSGNDCVVIGKTSIAVELDEFSLDEFDDIECVWAPWMTRQLHSLPAG